MDKTLVLTDFSDDSLNTVFSGNYKKVFKSGKQLDFGYIFKSVLNYISTVADFDKVELKIELDEKDNKICSFGFRVLNGKIFYSFMGNQPDETFSCKYKTSSKSVSFQFTFQPRYHRDEDLKYATILLTLDSNMHIKHGSYKHRLVKNISQRDFCGSLDLNPHYFSENDNAELIIGFNIMNHDELDGDLNLIHKFVKNSEFLANQFK